MGKFKKGKKYIFFQKMNCDSYINIKGVKILEKKKVLALSVSITYIFTAVDHKYQEKAPTALKHEK